MLSYKDEERVKTEITKQVIKQKRWVGKLEPKPGQFTWELDLVTSEIKHAVIDEVRHDLRGKAHKRIFIKENSLYCCAINRENAEKHFKKLINSWLQ